MSTKNLHFFFEFTYNSNHNRRNGRCKHCSTLVPGRGDHPYWTHVETKHQDIIDRCSRAKRLNSALSPPLILSSPSSSSSSTSSSSSSSSSLSSQSFSQDSNDFDDDDAPSKQIKLTSMFSPIYSTDVDNFHTLLIRFFSNNGIPHSFLDNEDFLSLLSTVQKFPSLSPILPQKKNYRSLVVARGNEIFAATLSKLSSQAGSPPRFITLAVDGWTGQKYGTKNTNTIALCANKSYLLWSDENSDDIDSAENYLFPLLQKQIKYLLEKNIIVSSLTTDNAANMMQLGTRLYQIPQQGKVILHISCSAHTIQLMIEKIVQLKPIATYVEDALQLIDAFTTTEGKKYRILLRKYQLNNDVKTPLKLVMYNSTRWLSRLQSLVRLCQLKSAIQFIALNGGNDQRPTLSTARMDNWWRKMSDVIIPFLSVFQTAMNIVQSDKSSLLDLNILLKKISQTISSCKFSHSTSIGCAKSTEDSFIKDAKSIIDSYVKSYISSTDHHAFTAVSILTDSNFPPPADSSDVVKKSFKNSTREATKWISEWGADFIIFYKNYFPQINCYDRNEVISQIIIQITMFEGATADFDDKQQNKNIYTIKNPSIISNQNNNNNQNEKEVDWKLFWTKYYNICPHLSTIALCLLSIGISEACVERSFSVQKLTHSTVRNGMKNDIVEAEMRLRFNKYNMGDDFADGILQSTASVDDENELSDVEDAPMIDQDDELN